MASSRGWLVERAATGRGFPRLVIAATIMIAACRPGEAIPPEVARMPPSIQVTSPDFRAGEPIPKACTCDGEDASPAIAWSGAPPGARSLVLICDDPDAPSGLFTHWVIYNLPPGLEGMPGGVKPTEQVLDTSGAGGRILGLQGRNEFGAVGYRGPCPPGGTHRYFFRIYALDEELKVVAGAGHTQVRQAMKGHVLAWGELMGKYSRQR